MTATGTDGQGAPRYEIKMVCSEREYPRAMAELRLDPLGLREIFSPRIVQSIYFDTHEGRALHENLAGVAKREKLRFRWYGPETRGVVGRLELKTRDNLLGTKQVLPIATRTDIERVSRHSLMRAILADCTPMWRDRLIGMEPVQWIRYQRTYMATPDARLRITLDRDLRAHDLRNDLLIRSIKNTILPRMLVVECKTAAEDRELIEDLMQRIPLLVDKCSKFVIASATHHGPIVPH